MRQAMEDTLVDTANVLAELATRRPARRADRRRRVRAPRARIDGRDLGAEIWGFGKRRCDYRIYVTDARGIVVFDIRRAATSARTIRAGTTST